MPWNLRFKVALCMLLVLMSICLVLPGSVRGDHLSSKIVSRRDEALKSIRGADAKRHIDALASDPFEGREAGTRGGRAAAIYLTQEFSKLKLLGGAAERSYIQEFGNNMQNVIGVLPGRDEVLKNEYLLVSAHYDHVGYGDARSSLGPIGHIHNGADDNASGVSALLEIAAAFTALEVAPRRSIIFALWDGEEKDLLGSRHWVSSPTIPLRQLKFMLNIDRVGRLTQESVEIGGVRTAVGLREIISRHNQLSLCKADYTWEIPDNSDHYPFFLQGIPFIYPFTGFHDDYHRPSDDADRVNAAGVERISKWMFSFLLDLSEAEQIPAFRVASRSEGKGEQAAFERQFQFQDEGLNWRDDPVEPTTILVVSVDPGSRMSKTGIKEGDRLYSVGDRRFKTSAQFREALQSQVEETNLLIEREGLYFTVKLPARGSN